MSNQNKTLKIKKIYDLEERTARFGEMIIDFIKIISKNETNRALTNQLVRSATSVGANYCEADGAESGKDFRHKIAICKKEAKESRHWLRMIARANPDQASKCRELWKEVHELCLIFSSMLIQKSKKRKV